MLTHDFNASGDSRGPVVHPANILFTVDRVIEDINRNTMLWESKLSKLLRACSRKQWQPILLDTQSSLRSIGGSLIALGMVEVVGRPVMMLYPVYMVILQALKLSKEIEMNNQRITVRQYLQMFKIGVYFVFAYLLLTVLAMYTGLGYTCLLIGGGAVAVASNDEFTKQAAPVIAPHMVNLDLMLGQLQRLEGAVVGEGGQGRSAAARLDESVGLLQGLFQQGMKLVNGGGGGSGGLSQSSVDQRKSKQKATSQEFPTDSRVEELDENDEPASASHSANGVTATGSSTGPRAESGGGLRYRQKQFR